MKIEYNHTELASIVAKHIVPLLSRYTIISLEGSVGAGKTTLTKELFTQLGVQEAITSPTYSYVNTYQANCSILHHFDLYRIDSLESFLANGFDEYLRQEAAICLIEWPAAISILLNSKDLADKHCQIILTHHSSNPAIRILEVKD